MFAVEVYAAVRHFVFIEGNSRRDAARVFGLSRETVSKMCRFSLPPGYTRTPSPASSALATTSTISCRLVPIRPQLRTRRRCRTGPAQSSGCRRRQIRRSGSTPVQHEMVT